MKKRIISLLLVLCTIVSWIPVTATATVPKSVENMNNQEKAVTPLTELQTMAFVLQELALYLDTHRDDAEALQMYRQYQTLYHDGRKTYEKMYGPLNHMSVDEGGYRWLDDPWPWEYAGNKEV